MQNEITKQQILKIRQENTKMESTIIQKQHQNLEVLVAVSLTMDTKTNSGVMEQCHNNMNDENDDNVDVVTPTLLLRCPPLLDCWFCPQHVQNCCIVEIVMWFT